MDYIPQGYPLFAAQAWHDEDMGAEVFGAGRVVAWYMVQESDEWAGDSRDAMSMLPVVHWDGNIRTTGPECFTETTKHYKDALFLGDTREEAVSLAEECVREWNR